MKPHRSALALTFAMTTSIPALAATNFTDGDPTDSLVSNPLNWDNGLPTGGANPGTLGLNAKANSTVLNGYDITHTAVGVISLIGFRRRRTLQAPLILWDTSGRRPIDRPSATCARPCARRESAGPDWAGFGTPDQGRPFNKTAVERGQIETT